MTPLSTHSLSPLEWTQLLRLWATNRDKLYGNFTVEQFIKYIVGTAAEGRCWVGRRPDGFIEAFTIVERRDKTLFVEAWAGPTKYVAMFDTTPFTHIEYQKGGKTFRHQLL